MAEFEPFNPKKHKPVQTVGQNYATEYTATSKSPKDNKFWNTPTIWFNKKTGKSAFFTGKKAWNTATSFEKSSGKKFPRYSTEAEAINAAKTRSKKGGATKTPLARNKGGKISKYYSDGGNVITGRD